MKKFRRCQRRFFPPMKNITCFSCHKPGHIAAHCKTRHINFNPQNMQQMRRPPQANRWKRQSFTRYTNHFCGYCYSCNDFGHVAAQCKTKKIKFNQQNMQQMRRLPQANKWKGQQLTRYINHFQGYCY